MANEVKAAELTEIIRECLINHGMASFDQSADYTENLVRAVAVQLETKLTGYTDGEIDKLRGLITGGEVDLKPITDLLALIKGELDGDESQDGFQALNKLISDVSATKELTASHSQTLSSIVISITAMNKRFTNHEDRLIELEKQINDGTGGGHDCEACINEMLTIMAAQQEAACKASQEVLATYATVRGAARQKAFLASLASESAGDSADDSVSADTSTSTVTVGGTTTTTTTTGSTTESSGTLGADVSAGTGTGTGESTGSVDGMG